MGIFKRFRASMTFGGISTENDGSDNITAAVYRPYAAESIFSPGYRVIDEGSYSSPSNVTTRNSRPKAKETVPKTKRSKSTPNMQTQASLSNGQAAVPPTSAVDDIQAGTSEGSSKIKTKKEKESKNKKDKENKKEKEKSKEKTKEKTKDKKEKKKEKQKVKVAEQVEDKSKSKKDKDKAKKDKTKAKKDESTPVASVTIDELAVASTQGEVIKTNQNTLPPPPYTPHNETAKVEPPKSRNILANPLAVQKPNNVETENTSATNSGFASSWDQVAMHRQNLHRELQTFKPQQNNLRSMMNKDRPDVGREPTNRFTPSTNSPRNITSRSYGNNRNNNSGSDGSGSEADA